jgi:hypothetical protein
MPACAGMTSANERGVCVARKKKLIIVPGKKPQLRQASAKSWSKAKGDEFLQVLGDTCNVSQACRASGLGMTQAYRRRKSDARFRAAWNERIAIGYQRLEAVLLDRAFNGTERVITRRDGSEERVREYPNHIALRLLQMHRETAMEDDSDIPPDDVAEIRERLVRKLQRLKKRDEAQDTGPQQLRNGASRDGGTQERG